MDISRSRPKAREPKLRHKRSQSAHATVHRQTDPSHSGIYHEELASYNRREALFNRGLPPPSPNPSDFQSMDQLQRSQPALVEKSKIEKMAQWYIATGNSAKVPWAHRMGPVDVPCAPAPTNLPVTHHVPTARPATVLPTSRQHVRRPSAYSSPPTPTPPSTPPNPLRSTSYPPGTRPRVRAPLPKFPPGPTEEQLYGGAESGSTDTEPSDSQSLWAKIRHPRKSKQRRKRRVSLPSTPSMTVPPANPSPTAVPPLPAVPPAPYLVRPMSVPPSVAAPAAPFAYPYNGNVGYTAPAPFQWASGYPMAAPQVTWRKAAPLARSQTMPPPFSAPGVGSWPAVQNYGWNG